MADLNDLNDLAEPTFKTLKAMNECWRGERYVVIGATGFRLRGHVFPRRSIDVDVAVAVSADDLTRLREALEPKGWEHVRRERHRWRHYRTGLEADVIPVADSSDESCDLGAGLTLDLRGLAIALESAQSLTVHRNGQTTSAPVPPTAVLCLLKMIANRDKPLVREKDATDVGRIVREYLPQDSMRRWEEPCVSIEDEDLKSACALGHDLCVHVGKYKSIVESFWKDQAVRGLVEERDGFGEEARIRGADIAHAFLVGFDFANVTDSKR